MRNHSNLNKTEAAFDKCSTKLGVLQNAIRQSIEPVLLIKERVFFSNVAGHHSATLLKMTPPQVSFKIFDSKCGTNIL